MAIDNRDQLRAAAAGQQVAKKDEGFPALLDKMKPQLALALPKHITADRMVRIALTCFRKNPKLGKCDPMSVMAGVVMSAQLGLELDILGRAYLVPYKNRNGGFTCQFIPGWRGMVDLVNRSGQASVWTGAVFRDDEFEYEYGTHPRIFHKPADHDGDPTNLLYTYAVGAVKGSEHRNIEVWPMVRIWRHRDRYNKVGDDHYSFNEPEMYARKVVLNQVLKYMPMSVEMSTAQQLSYAADAGAQRLDLGDALKGAFVIDAETDTGAAGSGSNEQPTGTTVPKKPLTDEEIAAMTREQIAAIKDCKTLQGLAPTWANIVQSWKDIGRAIPVEIDAHYGDRKATLEAAGSR